MKRLSRGYTLVEMLVVLGIVALLATLAMPLAEVTKQREREQEAKHSLWQIREALDRYRDAREAGALTAETASSSLYPDTLVALTKAWPDQRAAHKGETLRFLRQVPRNPFADPDLAADKSWGLRSFLSEAEKPQEGADVFDVYIPSTSKALNGTELKAW